jgi:hypothetical protein
LKPDKSATLARGRAVKFIVLLGIVSLFAGSALMGYLYDISIPSLVAFSTAAQLVSIPILAVVKRSGMSDRRVV